ncbi:glutaredoxin family protein [Peribacillus saganii]|uniref:Glutaredoxin family protein n=1 Tax=Peribacillus saganii TaxID=2303992 RepID=A0A372LTG5_9BACI|nr:glutaredoxin family protein [Peribacillus saganii]RFU71090.1 glutaredoxin family protein [Peribacillus saganii]
MQEIIVYSQPDCPPCKIMKMFLDEYQVSYTEKNIKADKQALKELTNKHKSYSTPTIVIDGQVIIGFDPTVLKRELNIQD